MQIELSMAKTRTIQASNNIDGSLDFIAECSSAKDKDTLLDLRNGTIKPKQAPDVLDFIGRTYSLVAKDKRFQAMVHQFFRDVIWKRFQKVVWSDKGTVGVDVPIEPQHVRAFLQVAKLPTVPQYVNNVQNFLVSHVKMLGK